MGIERSKCISIRSLNYRESDLIINLLTERRGRITALVKGARKQESKYGAAFDLLNLSELVYYEGENFVYPSQAELLESWEILKKDDERIQSGLRGAKRINDFLREGQTEHGVYEAFKETLSALNSQGEVNWKSVEIGFYLKLVRFAGLKPSLVNCSLCGKEIGFEGEANFSPRSGGVTCGDCPRPDDSFIISPGLRRSLLALENLDQKRTPRLKLSESDYKNSLKILDRLSSYHLELDSKF